MLSNVKYSNLIRTMQLFMFEQVCSTVILENDFEFMKIMKKDSIFYIYIHSNIGIMSLSHSAISTRTEVPNCFCCKHAE